MSKYHGSITSARTRLFVLPWAIGAMSLVVVHRHGEASVKELDLRYWGYIWLLELQCDERWKNKEGEKQKAYQVTV